MQIFHWNIQGEPALPVEPENKTLSKINEDVSKELGSQSESTPIDQCCKNLSKKKNNDGNVF